MLLFSVLCWYLLVFIYTVVGFFFFSGGVLATLRTLLGAEKAVLKELFAKIESNTNQQDSVFVCGSSCCFLQFQAFCFDTKKQPVLRCQPFPPASGATKSNKRGRASVYAQYSLPKYTRFTAQKDLH